MSGERDLIEGHGGQIIEQRRDTVHRIAVRGFLLVAAFALAGCDGSAFCTGESRTGGASSSNSKGARRRRRCHSRYQASRQRNTCPSTCCWV